MNGCTVKYFFLIVKGLKYVLSIKIFKNFIKCGQEKYTKLNMAILLAGTLLF